MWGKSPETMRVVGPLADSQGQRHSNTDGSLATTGSNPWWPTSLGSPVTEASPPSAAPLAEHGQHCSGFPSAGGCQQPGVTAPGSSG